MVVHVAFVDLQHVVVDVHHRKGDGRLRHTQLFELQRAHNAGSIFNKDLVGTKAYASIVVAIADVRFKELINEMGAQDGSFFETVEPRITAALGLSLAIVVGVAPHDRRGLLAYADRVAGLCNAAAHRAGWVTRPPFPGRTSGVQTIGANTRVSCATELWSETELLGVAFIVIVSGRKAQISVAPPGCTIPKEWQSLGSRFGP